MSNLNVKVYAEKMDRYLRYFLRNQIREGYIKKVNSNDLRAYFGGVAAVLNDTLDVKVSGEILHIACTKSNDYIGITDYKSSLLDDDYK